MLWIVLRLLGGVRMTSFWRNLPCSLGRIAEVPRYAVIATLTLALGIGRVAYLLSECQSKGED
jgi:hypothetical protein